MAATWQRLATQRARRGRDQPRSRRAGSAPTPPHSHGLSEEIYFVLAARGCSGRTRRSARWAPATRSSRSRTSSSTPSRAGPDGLEYLVFGTRHPVEYGWLPRSRAVRLGYPWVEGRDDDPWEVEAEVGGSSSSPSRASGRRTWSPGRRAAGRGRGTRRSPAARLRALRVNWIRRARPASAVPPHCHSAEEEAFVVLGGSGPWSCCRPRLADNGVEPSLTSCGPATSSAARRDAASHTRSSAAPTASLPRLRHARAERHRLLPALEQDLRSWRRGDRAARATDYGDGEPDDY